MAQTVIGMFESSSKAQDAVQELIDAGISRDRIDVSASNNTGSSYSSSETRNDDDNESGISKFFKSLFGDNDDDADKYTRVASRTQSMITVHAQTGDEAERVADILDDNGAVDVDEHAATMGYSSSGNNAGSGSAGLSNSGSSDYANSSLATDTTLGLASGTGGTTGFESTAGTTGYAGGNTGNADINDTESARGTTSSAGTGFTNTNSDEESRKIPIIEESLEVGKREVKTGGVRLRSRIIERPVEESVRLREERVNVERNTVDRAATDADFKNFQERDIEMVERAEVPVVNKEARVVEEVSIAKEVEERNETIKDTVRKTEVDVENLDKTDLKDTYSNKD